MNGLPPIGPREKRHVGRKPRATPGAEDWAAMRHATKIAAVPRVSPEAVPLYKLACALWRQGGREEAIARLDAAIRLRPDFADALSMAGYMLEACGPPDAALRFYRRAVEVDPSLGVARVNAGKLLFRMGQFAQVLEAFEAATAFAPDDADAWNSRSGALRELGRLEDSLEAARRALALQPNFPEAAINLGNALMKLDRMEEALAAYTQAAHVREDDAAAICGQGVALRNLGCFREAMSAFERAEALGSYEAIGNKGCLLLTLGDFERGWEGYEARWVKGKSISETFGNRFPAWSGPSGRPDRVLVFNDHGLGDTFQFVRYLPLMMTDGAKPIFVCPPKLWRLLSPSIAARFVEAPPEEALDAQIALSSLPHAFRTRLETIPAEVPYLKPEAGLREKWAERIGPAGLKVGVVWQGNAHPEVDRARSMPLAALQPLANVARVRLISLQKGFGEEQLSALPQEMRVETLGPDFDAGPDAFIDTAAVLAHLDLVVACDTSIAHLAGALGRPVWVALTRHAEWRWMTDRSDSPWYPTMTLFRQTRRGDWSDVFERMAGELRKWSESKGRGALSVRRARSVISSTGFRSCESSQSASSTLRGSKTSGASSRFLNGSRPRQSSSAALWMRLATASRRSMPACGKSRTHCVSASAKPISENASSRWRAPYTSRMMSEQRLSGPSTSFSARPWWRRRVTGQPRLSRT